jgi:hypothetical protein
VPNKNGIVCVSSLWIAITTISKPLAYVFSNSRCSSVAAPLQQLFSSPHDGLRGDSGNRCFGAPRGYSEVNGYRRAPWVAAKMIAMYSGSHLFVVGVVCGCIFWRQYNKFNLSSNYFRWW